MQIGTINEFYFYAYTGETSGVINCVVELKHTVDRDKLKLAVNKTLKRFPYMRLTPAIDGEGHVICIENKEECEIYPEDYPACYLGTDDTKGYLFVIRCGEKTIRATTFHGMGDARGALLFANMVVMVYLCETGARIDAEGILPDIDAPLLPEECAALYETCLPFREKIHPAKFKQESIFEIPMKNPLTGTDQTHRYEIGWKNRDMIALAKSMGVSVTAVLASVIAEAISENFDIGNEAITPYVPVDLREMLSCQAQSNFCCAIALPCSREDMNLSFLELCLQQKDRMKERMTKDNMAASVIAYGDMIREVTKGISLADEETVHGLQKMSVETAKKGKTYLLSNVGRITLPKGMLPYIQNELIYAPVIEDSPMAVVSTFGDTGHFEWHQNNDNDMMAKAIAKAFEKHDIRVRMKDFGRITSDKVQPYLFRRSKNDESQSKS